MSSSHLKHLMIYPVEVDTSDHFKNTMGQVENIILNAM